MKKRHNPEITERDRIDFYKNQGILSAPVEESNKLRSSIFETFEGERYIDAMPKILAKDKAPLNMFGFIMKRIYCFDDKDFWFKTHFDTCGGLASAPDGRFKIIRNSDHLIKINPNTELVDGLLPLEQSVYERLQGTEFMNIDRKYARDTLTEPEAKINPFWFEFAGRNQGFLDEYVGRVFKFLKEEGSVALGMRVILPPVNQKMYCLNHWTIFGYSNDENFTFCANSTYALNASTSRFVVIPQILSEENIKQILSNIKTK